MEEKNHKKSLKNRIKQKLLKLKRGKGNSDLSNDDQILLESISYTLTDMKENGFLSPEEINLFEEKQKETLFSYTSLDFLNKNLLCPNTKLSMPRNTNDMKIILADEETKNVSSLEEYSTNTAYKVFNPMSENEDISSLRVETNESETNFGEAEIYEDILQSNISVKNIHFNVNLRGEKRENSNYLTNKTSMNTLENHIFILNNNLEEYLLLLSELNEIYSQMRVKTPVLIRQYFDFAAELIKDIFDFQCKLNKCIKYAGLNISLIAKSLLDDDFNLYKTYIIICSSIYDRITQFTRYFDVQFPQFKNLILLPSSRLNFYVQTLKTLSNFASNFEIIEINKAIDYLDSLKHEANVNMTINIIKKCPFDVNLLGNLLYTENVIYNHGILSKQPYRIFLFDELLIFTVSKVSKCTYVTHFRYDQILDVFIDNNQLVFESLNYNSNTPEVHFIEGVGNKSLIEFKEQLLKWSRRYKHQDTSKNCLKNKLQITSKNFPLSLSEVFPEIEDNIFLEMSPLFKDDLQEKKLAKVIIKKETDYVIKMRHFFNSQNLPPPPDLQKTLLKILNFHELHFLPDLKNCLNNSKVTKIFLRYLENFEIYKTFIAQRVLLTSQLPDGIKAQYYILPIQHFIFYIQWVKNFENNDDYSDFFKLAINTLLRFVNETKIIILQSVIPNCRMEFGDLGNIIKKEKMYVKVSSKRKFMTKNFYTVVLFSGVILILFPNPPHYKLIINLWINQIDIGPFSSTETSLRLEYRQGADKDPLLFEFKIKDIDTKYAWIDSIKSLLYNQAKHVRNSSLYANCRSNLLPKISDKIIL